MAIDTIIQNYESDNLETQKRLRGILNHGALKGTGKMIVLAVDQGFEHGPTRSFGQNMDAYDPHYHFNLAVKGGLSAFAAPLGLLESGYKTFQNKVPTILKLNSSNTLHQGTDYDQAITGSVADAVRLGCHGIGFTLYPGSEKNLKLISELQRLSAEAKEKGLVVVAWSYPRGRNISKDGETALDVVTYGAHMACLLGAHIIKVKVPSHHLCLEHDKKMFAQTGIPHKNIEDRISYVVKGCFAGRRIVIFSGGTTKSDEDLLAETRGIRDGGGFGSIVGRNFFQRPETDALDLMAKMVSIYKGEL